MTNTTVIEKTEAENPHVTPTPSYGGTSRLGEGGKIVPMRPRCGALHRNIPGGGKIVMLGMVSGMLAFSAYATDIYVNGTTGSDNNDGSSAAKAYGTLQKAARRLNELKVDGVTIHVAGGTYAPAEATYHGGGNPLHFFVVGEGTAENPVVIDGENTKGCFRITNANKIGGFSNVIFRNGRSPQGGGIGCYAGWTTSSASGVTNCVFENCHSTNGCGGAVLSYGYATSFSNCTFRGCSATYVSKGSWAGQVKNGCGGAVLLNNVTGDCFFTDCHFETNRADVSGGAVMMQVDTSTNGPLEHADVGINLTDCSFEGNVAGQDGVVNACVRSCERTTFVGNTAGSSGSVWYLNGYLSGTYKGDYLVTNRFSQCTFTDNFSSNGACFGWNYNKRLEIENCTIERNVSSNGAAVVRTDGGSSHCLIRDSSFLNNAGQGVFSFTANVGARMKLLVDHDLFASNDAGSNAFFVASSASHIQNSRFTANRGGCALYYQSNGGGAVYHVHTLRNCLFDHNTNTVNEGVLRIFWTLAETADVCNNTFVDNVAAGAPTALWINSVATYENKGCLYANNLLFGNRKNDGTAANQTAGVFNSFATTNWIEQGGTPLSNGTRGNVVAENPRFVDRAGGDYMIRYASACRDSGTFFDWMTDVCDIRSDEKYPRVTGVAPDIGCYEWQPGKGFRIFVR